MVKRKNNISTRNIIMIVIMIFVIMIFVMAAETSTIEISAELPIEHHTPGISGIKDMIATETTSTTSGNISESPDFKISETIITFKTINWTSNFKIKQNDTHNDTILWPSPNQCIYSSFNMPCEPQKYIMPDSDVVRLVSTFMKLNDRGVLEWIQHNPFNRYGEFYNIYASDDLQFKYPPNDDYWINPDYYFTHGMIGDCEDASLAMASVLEAKEVKTKIVGGYLSSDGQRAHDWAVEYKINGTYYWYFGGLANLEFIMKRNDFEQYKKRHPVDFEPILMFSRNISHQDYDEWW